MKHTSLFSLTIAILIIGCKNNDKAPSTEASMAVVTSADAVIVAEQKLENSIFSSGNVLANEEVTLKSEVAGRIISIHFDEGSRVKKNQLLFKIDDSELKAQLSKASIQLKLAETDYGRRKQLDSIKAISQEELDMASNKVAELKADKYLLMAQIEKSSVRAPFDGYAGLRTVSPGAFVASGDVLTTVVQKDPVKLEFTVPEFYASMVEEKGIVNFYVAGINDTFTAQIYAYEPRIEKSSRNLLIRAKAQNKSGKLLPGSFASVRVPLRQLPSALMIPAEAIIPDLNGQKVLQVKNGVVKNTTVHTGIRTESAVQITQGLQAGDTVLITGLLQLRQGTPVSPKIIQ